MKRQDGMTLVELMVSLSIILIVMAVATAAYLEILKSYKTYSKVSQSYMANLTGLELLRYDIQMAGFGLPADMDPAATCLEAVAPGAGVFPTSYNPTALNDSTAVPPVPRPLVILNNGGRNGSDVLAIKSSVASINSVSRKWSMIRMVGGVPQVKPWGGATLDAVSDFTANDRFIVLDAAGKLMPASAGPFALYTFAGNSSTTGYYSDASPVSSGLTNQSVFFTYGLDDGLDPTTAAHRMPFNRVDYYLDTSASQSCPNDFTLYRSVINQSDGLQSNPMPLIDCVRNFQVAVGLDGDADNNVDLDAGWSANPAAMTATVMRTQVREVRVFILYHEGTGDVSKRKPDFRFSGTLNLGDQDIAHSLDAANYSRPPNNFQTLSTGALTGTPSLHSYTPAGTDAQYRWKVLELAIKPMNLKTPGL